MPRSSIIDEDVVFQLIEEVKKRNWLINNNVDTEHVDRLTVMKGWSDVAEELGTPVSLVKQKWKSLRDMFWKEVRRCGGPDTYCGKWRFYNHMTFIYKLRKKPDNIDDDSDRGDPETDEEATVTNKMKTEMDHDSVVFITESEDPLQGNLKINQDEVPNKKVKHNQTKTEDFDLMFLTSLTPYFKRLDPLRKLVIRNKIQDMLFSELSAQVRAKNESY